jgi:phosphoenolpyruvate phosphomutase
VECDADFAVVVDSIMAGAGNRTVRDFAYCSQGDDRGLFGAPVLLRRVDDVEQAPSGAAHGRWIGMLSVSRQGLQKLKETLARLRAREDFDSLGMPALLNALAEDDVQVRVLYIHGHWTGVNDVDDLRQAVDFAHAQAPLGR